MSALLIVLKAEVNYPAILLRDHVTRRVLIGWPDESRDARRGAVIKLAVGRREVLR